MGILASQTVSVNQILHSIIWAADRNSLCLLGMYFTASVFSEQTGIYQLIWLFTFNKPINLSHEKVLELGDRVDGSGCEILPSCGQICVLWIQESWANVCWAGGVELCPWERQAGNLWRRAVLPCKEREGKDLESAKMMSGIFFGESFHPVYPPPSVFRNKPSS